MSLLTCRSDPQMTVMMKETVVEAGLLQPWLSTIAYWVYVGLTILAPCLYIIWLVQKGVVSDFHLPKREQRLRPLLFSLATALIAWVLFQRGDVPAALRMLASVNSIQAILFLLITLRWKISLHCATAAILAELLLCYFGPLAAPFALSVPLIAWSRLHLRRHTLAQTIAGTTLGLAILTPALYVYGF
jgi:hypothetical protein